MDVLTGVMILAVPLVTLSIMVVAFSLANLLRLRALTEELLHEQARAGESALNQFKTTIEALGRKAKAKEGN